MTETEESVDQSHQRFWLTGMTAAIRDFVSNARGTTHNRGPLVEVLFRHEFPDSARGTLHALCADQQVMILHSGAGVRGLPPTPVAERPAQPLVEPLDAGEALPMLLRHLIRPPDIHGSPQTTPTGAQILMRIAHALPDAAFYRVTPGGTPAMTAESMKLVIEP